MKILAALAALSLGMPAIACLPPPPGYVDPPREELLASAARIAPNIVYAVVDRTLRDEEEGPTGSIRILHVYKGNLRVGQRIPMVLDNSHSMCNPTPPPFAEPGDYGVLLLEEPEPGEPLRFRQFVFDSDVALMIRHGIIVSAQGPGARQR